MKTVNGDFVVLDAGIAGDESAELTELELNLILGGYEPGYNEQQNNPSGNAWDLRSDSGGSSDQSAIDTGAMANTIEVSAGAGAIAGGIAGAAVGSFAGPAGTVAGTVGGAEAGALAGAALGTAWSFGWEMGEMYAQEISEFIDYVGEVQATTDKM